MSDPNDFTQPTKNLLEGRAGHRCSAPFCRAPTSGPSETRASKVSNAGVAAHIAGARADAARFDPGMSPAERSRPSNGIWLCQTHAKLIDDDAQRYTVQLLHAWKDRAEEEAAATIGRPAGHVARVLVEYRRDIPADRDRLAERTAAFVEDVGVAAAWTHADSVRMLLFELADNAIRHGGATELSLASTKETIELRDNGSSFEIERLRPTGSGGRAALLGFEVDSDGSLSVRGRRSSGSNVTLIADESSDSAAFLPCSVRSPDQQNIGEQLDATAGCAEIHVYLGGYASYSQ